MSDPAVLDRLDIHQGGRWYFWRYEGAPPLPVDEITRSSANVHLIPADRAVARALRGANAGQRITLRGYLVELRAADGWHWKSSLRRDDSGDGSCELMYVQAVSRPDPGRWPFRPCRGPRAGFPDAGGSPRAAGAWRPCACRPWAARR